jgi:hypothetical protein
MATKIWITTRERKQQKNNTKNTYNRENQTTKKNHCRHVIIKDFLPKIKFYCPPSNEWGALKIKACCLATEEIGWSCTLFFLGPAIINFDKFIVSSSRRKKINKCSGFARSSDRRKSSIISICSALLQSVISSLHWRQLPVCSVKFSAIASGPKCERKKKSTQQWSWKNKKH